MFHRVKSEPAQPQGPFNQAPQTPSPSQPLQQAPKQDTRPAAPADDNQLVNAVTNSVNTPKETPKDTTPKKEEATTMTEQPKKPETQDNAPRALEIPGSGYQRPGQPPVRAAGNFPGSYPGYNPHAASAAASAVSTDRRLIIGRGITMSGEIESCDHLIVEGTVEATLKGASVLDIAESGVFYGTVEIDEATVAGRFEGDIHVNGRLTIRTGGAITGSITYKELEVEAGATIDGRLSPVGAAGEGKKPNSSTKNRDAAKKRDNNSQDDDNGLFASKAAAE